MTFVPADWADAKPGPKHWTEDARGDDPAAREVHRPTGSGPGDGKTFAFLFGYKTASAQDQAMLAAELDQIGDDVAVLRAAGYTVVVDRQATREDLLEAVAGAGFYWSSHGGADGVLECCDGARIGPDDLDPAAASPGLRLAVLGACYVGAYAPAWRAALGGHPLVAGWGRPVTLERAVDFLDADQESGVGLDDLIARWLLTDAPIPPAADAGSLPPPAVTRGRTGRLARRVPAIAAHLGAEWAEHDNHFDVRVPLPAGRTHVVQVFAVDGSDPYAEGLPLCGFEAPVGPMSTLVTPERLLAGSSTSSFGRTALVDAGTGVPQIVTQSFAPLTGTPSRLLAAHCHQVAAQADALENALFGGDE
ncbi:hypothetical protein ACQPZJ_36760 [Actinoplanes sp. CA-054009]